MRIVAIRLEEKTVQVLDPEKLEYGEVILVEFEDCDQKMVLRKETYTHDDDSVGDILRAGELDDEELNWQPSYFTVGYPGFATVISPIAIGWELVLHLSEHIDSELMTTPVRSITPYHASDNS